MDMCVDKICLTLSDNFGSIVAYLHGIGYNLVNLKKNQSL